MFDRFKLETFSSLRHRDFRYLWIGTSMMSGGQWIQQVTLNWLMYEMTNSAVLLGLLNGVRAFPFLISSPIAGVAADRMDRRKLMVITQYFLMVMAFLMGILVASGRLEVWHLLVVTFISGLAWGFSEPVRLSMVPDLVPRDELTRAIALNSVAFNATKVLGPALGGTLIALFGPAGNFFVQGVAYFGVLLTLYSIQFPATPNEARRSSAFANLKEGLTYVGSTPTVLALLGGDLVLRVFVVPYMALMPIFQKDVFHVGPEGLGMLVAAAGFGAVLGVLTLASAANHLPRKGLVLIWGEIVLGIFLVLFSFVTSFPLALILLVGVGYWQIVSMVMANTLIQIIVPDALRGRVIGLYMLDRGLIPAGSLLSGLTAHFLGAPATVGIMGVFVVLLALGLGYGTPLVRKIEA
ncbi:MAG: MFS transporter [Candidatus Binatia bacterium]